MQPIYAFSDAERDELYAALESVAKNPYENYPAFSTAVGELVQRGVPDFLVKVTDRVREERQEGVAEAHALRNCPRDEMIPVLDHDDPQADKYTKKKTFIAETFLELFGQLTSTPLLAYATRFKGDFFTDVIAINKYSGKQTGYSDGELVFHNDRTAHPVRADFITLLGMRCPIEEVTYTSFVGGSALLAALTPDERHVLRQNHFITPFDVVSRDNNDKLTVSGRHPIFENEHSIRYLDTHTTVAPEAPPEAKDALLALKNALARAERTRHRILEGDLFTFANQDGLHNREKIEVIDPERSRSRWLLKTYAFRDQAAADRHTDRWLDGIAGRVGD
ncbi:MAG: Taurine catabolism dioxygenase TauD, TfdA family [Amycolatopsis sp.]|jgi:L-asparagine oxygenase|uniref:TauD/TfdA family dioxygenase n=1 Tax=Amycolatopsis sp. TaxID=37632 RepID=UPI0026394984|nr:TauD/TfdA family dioxygenase [Amycolatopsis sp.]MCU1686587.1 Taurine catabolism dioxygenase TauD, TfdA family [Amycolatopsis sp.]